MASSRWNADLAFMALALGAVSLAYATGAFVLGLALHPPGQRGWSGAGMIAVSLYPLAWIGLLWGATELRARFRGRKGEARRT